MIYNSLLYRNTLWALWLLQFRLKFGIDLLIWRINRLINCATRAKDGSSPFLFTLPCFKSSLCYVRINPFIEFYPMEHAYPLRSTTRINIHPLLFPFSHQFLSPPSLRFGRRATQFMGREVDNWNSFKVSRAPIEDTF